MKKPARILVGSLIFLFFVYAAGRAGDQYAHASARGPVAVNPPSVAFPVSSAVSAHEQAPLAVDSRAASIRAIRQVFGTRAYRAIPVSSCETGGTFDAHAVNWKDRHSDGSRGSFGLFQIGALHRDRGESVAHFARRMWEPVANARKAYGLSHEGTRWGPWGRCGA